MRRKNAFTLIEMLVVISVIGILAGLTFKMMQLSTRNAQRAETVAKLQKVEHALNEFKAEYGMYPPVAADACSLHGGCRVCYQFENTNKQSNYAVMELDANPDLVNLFDMGLVAFLEKRYHEGFRDKHLLNKEWDADTARDELAKESWSEFLEGGVISDGDDGPQGLSGSDEGLGGGTTITNSTRTIVDSWNHPIKYECDPPYLSYKLWSVGFDGDDGTADDLNKKTWDN